MRKIRYAILSGIMAVTMVVECGAVYAAKPEKEVYINEVFDDYATNSEPEAVFTTGGKAKVIEYSPYNKAMILPPSTTQSVARTDAIVLGSKVVFGTDVYYSGGELNMTFGLNATKSGKEADDVFLKIINGVVYTADGKEIGKIEKNIMTSIDIALNSNYLADIYINGSCKVTKWKSGSKLKSAAVSVTVASSEDTTVYVDNMRAYSGNDIVRNLPAKAYNGDIEDNVGVVGEFGDFTYFDNRYCYVGQQVKYERFTAAPKTNEIVTNRLINPRSQDRKDYIYMKQTDTSQDCFFDVDLYRDGWEGDKNRIFTYYLIQGDFKSTLGARLQMFMIRDTSNGSYSSYVYMEADGSLRFQNGTVVPTGIEKGKEFNYKMYVNMDKHTTDIYVDGKKIASDIPINENMTQITKMRCSIDPGGSPTELYVDNFNVTGLANPYDGTEDSKTDIFTDETAEREYLKDKQAVHVYGKLMYANGEKSKIDPEPIYDKEKDDLFVSATTVKKLFGEEKEINVTENTVNGVGLELGTKASQNGELYVPVKETAQKIYGKHVFSMENGLIIFSDRELNLNTDNWDYVSFRTTGSSSITTLDDIDYLNTFLTFERPDKDTLLADYKATTGEYDAHPRLLLNKEGFENLRNLYQTDESYKKVASSMLTQAENYYNTDVETYKWQDSFRTLTVAETLLNKFRAWGYAYQITRDQKWIDRAWKEFQAVATFPDYNVAHIIDTAEYLAGFALGYDWMYEGFTEEQREFIADFVYEKGVKILGSGLWWGLSARSVGTLGSTSFLKSTNYNTLINGAIIMSATAFMEKDPEHCAKLVSGSAKSMEYSTFLLMPGGAWVEAFPYWNFAMQYMIYGMGTLDSAFGSSYGIDKAQGVDQTLNYAMACIGSNGINNYHDSGTGIADENMYSYDTFSYLAKKFNSKEGAAMRAYTLNEISGGGFFDALFYDADMYKNYKDYMNNLETVQKIDGLEMFSVRDTYDKKNCGLYFSTQFGPTSCYHSHNDTGAFVLDLMGERWADDLGADDYLLQNELGYSQSDLYRYRTEGHNTFTVNNGSELNQTTDLFFDIDKYDSNDYSAYMVADLPYLYKDVPEMKMGYFIGDNKTSVTMRGEMTANRDSEIYWFMHTRANIFVDGDYVYLTKNGKTVKVEFLCDDAEATIEEMKAQPLSSSPQAPEQNQNESFRKIAIKFNAKANEPTSLTVKISCVGKPSTPISNESIDSWKLQDELKVGDNYVDTSFDVTYMGEPVTGELPIYDGVMPEINITPKNPECKVDVQWATNADEKTVIKVWDKNHTTFSLALMEYFEASGENINMFTQLPVQSIEVSDEPEEANSKDNAIDGSLLSRWTCHKTTDWAVFDLGSVQEVDGVAIAHWKGSKRNYYFDMAVSEDGVNFEKIYTNGASPGDSETLMVYRFDKTYKARYIKYFAKGNSEESASGTYTNILEFRPLKNRF